MADLKAVELLFQRPLEPSYTPKDDGKTVFELPDSYYDETSVGGVRPTVDSRFGGDVTNSISLPELKNKPDLRFAKKLGKKNQFSLFQDSHRAIAAKLMDILIKAPASQFVPTAVYVKERVNPILFQYCYSIAVQHRPDTRSVPVPPIAETFPANFVEPSALKDARELGSVVANPGDRMHIEIPLDYTASNLEQEQRLAYFREDIGVNSHHWHWHLVYPGEGTPEVVRKDRRGELFYYMHHQLMARYNVERFCNGLGRVIPLSNLRDPLVEGYFPKILSSTNQRTYPARVANQRLQDLTREDNMVEIDEVNRWRDRIFAAIDMGYVVDPSGKQYPLDEVKGIDYLGDMVERSDLSINREFYGNLHNMGHNLISLCHDPDARHKEEFGVMGDVTTAMRDPIFFRWHTFIDNLFNRHKLRLPPYGAPQLGFDGVNVTKAEVKLSKGPTNVLLTYWQHSEVDLAAGLDFGPRGNVFARFTHLQNAPFEYTISVNNSKGARTMGTCRIFIIPQVDERGGALSYEDKRMMAIELDKFRVDLNPGMNTIRRRSDESSVTIPFERSFRTLPKDQVSRDSSSFRFCGCGWPQHLLIPKGNQKGVQFDLFVMVSDYTGDAVNQTRDGMDPCDDAASFCGLRDKMYPDKRSMGYPFDRRLPGSALDELTNSYSNMTTTPVTIQFQDVHVRSE